MDEKQYLAQRVDDQLKYYSTKSSWNQKRYRWFKLLTIVMAVLIPFLSGFSPCEFEYVGALVGLLGVLIAFSEGVLTLFGFRENWVEYRMTCEMLKQEKMLFLTKTDTYKGNDEQKVFKLFVERVEQILAAETNKWRSNNEPEKLPEDKKI